MTAGSIQFSSFILDLDRMCVIGPAGKAELRPKSFDVLRYLVEHSGRVIGKEELIDAVWPNLTVTDESLTRCISDVRHALGDASQEIIKTVPKRGYLLDVEVSVVDATIGAEARRVEAYAPDDFFFLTEGRPTVAVFPFAAISDSQSANCVGGFAKNIIVALSRCTWLTVIAGHIVQVGSNGHRAEGQAKPNYALRGTVARIGNRFRVTVHLLQALSGVQIWADRFDGDTDDALELQARIAERVATAMEPVLENAEFRRSKQKSIEDLSPYELLLRARMFENEYTKESMTEAIYVLRQALRIDPRNALAMALSATCYGQRREQGWSENSEEDTDEGLRLAIQALEIERQDARVVSMGGLAVRSLGNDSARGWELATRSLELNPNSTMGLARAAWAEVFIGNPVKALELSRRAERLNPNDPKAWYTAAVRARACFDMAQYEAALRWSERSLALNPSFASSLRTLAASWAKLGRIDEAVHAVARLLHEDPHLTLSAIHRRQRHMHISAMSRWLDALRIAGLPA
jgi:DNA-binding winged helix-turn-helix (wHTH) protein/TolB-like protein